MTTEISITIIVIVVVTTADIPLKTASCDRGLAAPCACWPHRAHPGRRPKIETSTGPNWAH